MSLKHISHMNVGNGETSYANNSGLQQVVISKTWAVLDKTLKDMYTRNNHNNGFPKCIKIADLGCASGPNTLFLISHMMDTIEDLCKHNNVKNLPQLEVFLNDLPDNDFNNLFKLLPNFCGKECKFECFMYGVPGSFYGRLFPGNSLNFAYSSYSLHWLSQIPEEVGVNNKENIYIATNSPPRVCEAYAKQFQRDFSRFLRVRAEEITPHGRMVLTFIGRSVVDPLSKDELAVITMLAETLSDMVAQGLVKKDDLYSFNMPMYTPCLQEIEAIIGDEGSFNLDKVEVVRVAWDAHKEYDDKVFDKNMSGKLVADGVRAFMEPMLTSHFCSSIADRVFDSYAERMAEHLSKERSSYFSPVISLTRKIKDWHGLHEMV
ncbi:benzoate carboxyl methyltransferase [Phtheirospermum japonicum]|uniref:Benzoate carboxyl methyltransferase n=1 Tax=Phtheirospermum japonicum TaxID=374723 RepID=A0A830BZA1_9LAMI|nr:benzoate carboxyl methyltransferase [Phtheirospermum japonicum]